MLPTEAIEEYIKLYEKRFGVVLSDTEASFRANKLVKFYKTVLGIESTKIKQKVEEFSTTIPNYAKD